jgi:hypothetical protein
MHYLIYLLGVVCLVLPSVFFTGRRLDVATIEQLAEREKQRFAWLHIYNGLDFVRAWAGMWLMLIAFRHFEAGGDSHLYVRALSLVVGLAGLAVQHGFFRKRDNELTTPVAYILGLATALLPVHILLPSLALGVSSAIAMRHLGAGLAITSIAVMALDRLFGHALITSASAAIFLFTPVLVSSMCYRRLALTIKRRLVKQAGPVLREVPMQRARA